MRAQLIRVPDERTQRIRSEWAKKKRRNTILFISHFIFFFCFISFAFFAMCLFRFFLFSLFCLCRLSFLGTFHWTDNGNKRRNGQQETSLCWNSFFVRFSLPSSVAKQTLSKWQDSINSNLSTFIFVYGRFRLYFARLPFFLLCFHGFCFHFVLLPLHSKVSPQVFALLDENIYEHILSCLLSNSLLQQLFITLNEKNNKNLLFE